MKTKIYALRDDACLIRYIGKTVKTLEQRLSGHLFDAKRGDDAYRCRWIRSLLNKGTLPSITLIEEVDGDGCAAEISWIKYFRDHGIRLTNGTDGGDGTVGRIASEETKLKLSIAHKRENLSEESRCKMSIAAKKKKFSEETRRKMSIARKGRKRSEETRLKISMAKRNDPESMERMRLLGLLRKGKRMSEENKQKLFLSNKGKKHSEETRQRMSIAQKGRKHSDETRRKLSDARKAWLKRSQGDHEQQELTFHAI